MGAEKVEGSHHKIRSTRLCSVIASPQVAVQSFIYTCVVAYTHLQDEAMDGTCLLRIHEEEGEEGRERTTRGDRKGRAEKLIEAASRQTNKYKCNRY